MAKYKDLIFPSEKSINSHKKQEAVEEAQASMRRAIFEAEEDVRKCSKIATIRTRQVPFNPEDVLNAYKDLKTAQNKLEALHQLNSDLF